MTNKDKQFFVDDVLSEENKTLEGNIEVLEKNNEISQEIDDILNRQQIENETNLDELLAIIAEIGLDKKEILSRIKNTNESEGIALNSAEKNNEVGVLVGKNIISCVVKEDIDQYEKVTFVSSQHTNGAYVMPLRTYSKKIQYKTAYEYDSDDNITYIGEALPGTEKSDSKWRIKKFIYDSNDNIIDIETAFGTSLFNNVWNNRANYNYS